MADTAPPLPFRDPTLSVEARLDDLVPRLTLREKVGQLNQRMLGWHAYRRDGGAFATTDALHAEIERWGGIGALYGLQRADPWSGVTYGTGIEAEHGAEVAALVQGAITAGSRFGIPALLSEEIPHGHQALDGELWPTAIGIGATWRPELLEEAAARTAADLRARGANLGLMTGLDILRDPRWGRAEETFGEDPLLAARFLRAVVRGLQGDDPERLPGDKVAVVLKAFAAHGAPIGGRNGSSAQVGPRELREVHLPAARAGFAAGALSTMAAYNDIDGVPAVAHRELLTGVLRGEWGFAGFVMSDLGAIDRLIPSAGSGAAAAAIALRAGVDLSLGDEAFTELERAVEEGLATEADVDLACRRVLGVKIRLGMLDADPAPAPPRRESAGTLPLMRASAVLLSNRGGLLPLASPPRRVAVIGPNADDVQCLIGDYSPPMRDGQGVTIAAGIRARLGADAEVTIEPGSELLEPIPGGIDRAMLAARDADLVVFALGGSSVRYYDQEFLANGAAVVMPGRRGATSGEGFDLGQVRLPRAQRELVRAVAAVGTPSVAVIVSGRPFGVAEVVAACDAVLYAWYPGPDGGTAIADLVLGDAEPTGRLPVSLAHRSEDLPVAYNDRWEHSPGYLDGDGGPDFRFGAGLGYTEWRLGTLAVAQAASFVELGRGEVAVTAGLTNVGDRAGSTVVQLYARQRFPGLTPRRAVLVGFERAELAAGERREVAVAIDPDALPALGLDADTAGALELWVSVTGADLPGDGESVVVTIA